MNKKLFVIATGVALTLTATQAESAASAFQETIKSSITLLPKTVWELVDRDTARFPTYLSKENTGGCATVEYTLTPENQITDVNVVSASRSYFAKAAHNAIKKWDFKAVEGPLTLTEITTQTRFEFCIASSVAECLSEPESFCSGEDVIAVVARERANDETLERAWTYERRRLRVD